jgi:hypothetical protein
VAAWGAGMNAVRMKRTIPWTLIALRVLGCPLIIIGQRRGWAGSWLALIVVVALLSDIYDGILVEMRDIGVADIGFNRRYDLLSGRGVGFVAAGAGVLHNNWILFAVLFG